MALSGVRQEYLYICVQEMHEEGYAITETCDILNLNRSSYYKWTHQSKSSSALENEALLHDIGLIYAETCMICIPIKHFIKCIHFFLSLEKTVCLININRIQRFAD